MFDDPVFDDDEESTMTWGKMLIICAVGIAMWAIIIERSIAWYRLIRGR
jgi:biopolymer transport protein ExbB/TolQ